MSDHAPFSLSASARWMTCAASFRECAGRESPDSPQAARGRMLHGLAAQWLQTLLVPAALDDLPGEDREVVSAYVSYVLGVLERSGPTARLFVEQRVRLSEDLWGTADAIVLAPHHAHIIDLKTGAGVPVPARSPQFLSYAACLDAEVNVLPSPLTHPHPPQAFHLHVVQPALEPISSEVVVTRAEVLEHRRDMERAVLLARSPQATHTPTAEACRWCPARGDCSGRAAFNEALAAADFLEADLGALTNERLLEILPHLDQFESWVRHVREEALRRALEGTPLLGWRVVASGGSRRWRDAEEAIRALREAGVPEEVAVRRTPCTIGEAERALGRRHALFTGDLLERSPTRPTLAPAGDRRPDWVGDPAALFADC